ncbi:threonine/serine exporter family protein [Enterococcus thailandicus]|uniref:threonine/serine exporter family protein n=1 Tax=Enterococcus thailandicus TaxID=417368 RepID=UPI0022EBB973|nr:threonine/serine exporter family protein [Enterococcus thailandicus]MDA3972959.1 threonine/serine exporter family protein [Enterococcus thailandicus]MDA3975607.1 threonine/serine exporter family protein [Enterococcus thailandicus]MDA3980419.1 threonine/serine exporter family protein [Enterococcus thailandicus]
MWTILIQFSFSFLATAAFAIITNVPRSALAWCGFSGALGWMIYWATITFGGNAAFGSLLGSLGVAFISDVFSKKFKMPVTIFNIPGMVPLVPGGLAYQAVRNLVTGSYQDAITYAVQAIMIAGAIALGLVLSEVFNHNIRNFKLKRESMISKRKKKFLPKK